MKVKYLNILIMLAMLLMSLGSMGAASGKQIGINVLLNTAVTDEILVDLGQYGKINDILYQIDAITMKAASSQLEVIRALPYVSDAAPDAVRKNGPVDTVFVDNFADGMSTWNLDAINVTDYGTTTRQVGYDGAGVYVAVLDTGLVKNWQQYLPEERIATEYAISFGGGGGEKGEISTQPNKWGLDVNSHGTHVTSTIIGYSMRGESVNGVAPMVKIIPVKVLNQNGSGWSSMVAAGIVYIADLKLGALKDYPVVINMSLGGPVQEPVEKIAIDYAIEAGVIIVASAGNEGEEGMGYPGAYAPVISVAASGWVGEWYPLGDRAWWNNKNVIDPTDPEDFYITDWSSRELSGQELDVAAPGSWVVGPYQLQMGKTSYYFLGGTSMASPHVAGIAALLLQKDPTLMQEDVEDILKSSALYLAPDCRTVNTPYGYAEEFCWGADATGAGLALADAALAAVP